MWLKRTQRSGVRKAGDGKDPQACKMQHQGTLAQSCICKVTVSSRKSSETTLSYLSIHTLALRILWRLGLVKCAMPSPCLRCKGTPGHAID